MPPVKEEKPESIVLKKILVEKHLHVKERVSPEETVLDIQVVEPLKFKFSLEKADGILKPEGDKQEKGEEQEKVALEGELEEEKSEMTPTVSRKSTLTGEKTEVAIDHVTYAKDKPPLTDEELKFSTGASEHAGRDSGEEEEDDIKLIVHREGAVEKVSDELSVLQRKKRKVPVQEKEEEIVSTYIRKRTPRQPYEPRDSLGKERKSKVSLQAEEFPIKDKISFIKDIAEAGRAETPLLKTEERGGFTLEKSEVPLGESMKEYGIQSNAQWMKKSDTTTEIPIDKILNKEAKKMEVIQDGDENIGFTSAELHSLVLYEETEPALRKDVDLEHPTEDKEVPREVVYIGLKPSVLKPEVVESKAKYSAEEGDLNYEKGSGQLLAEKALLVDKKTGKKIIPEKGEKTTFSTHLKKGNIRQSNAPEKLTVEKEEFDTVITGKGMEGDVSMGERENGVKGEIVDRSESVKEIPIQPPGIQDKKQFQEVHTIQCEVKETLAPKSSKDKTEEKSLTVEEMKLLGKELGVTGSTSDEKTSAKHGTGKNTPVTMKKEKEKLSDKIPSSKRIPANGEVTYSSSTDKNLTPKKAEKGKEYQKSEHDHVIEQVSRLLSENRNLDAPGESREVLDVPAKSHAKRGEEDCYQILPQSTCTICFRRIPFAIVMFVFVLYHSSHFHLVCHLAVLAFSFS